MNGGHPAQKQRIECNDWRLMITVRIKGFYLVHPTTANPISQPREAGQQKTAPAIRLELRMEIQLLARWQE